MNKKTPLVCTLLLFLGIQLFSQENNVKTPYQNTRLTVNKESTVTLKGPWHFYWGKFLSYDEVRNTQPDAIVKLPSTWNNYGCIPPQDQKTAAAGKGAATYHLVVTNLEPETVYSFRTYDLASTAVKIIINGKTVFQAGKPNEDWRKTKVGQEMELATFTSGDNGKADILMYVSNFSYRNGGLWKAPEIGKYSIEAVKYRSSISLYSILSGIIFSVMMYGLFLFIIKKDKASLFLSLFAFSILVRFFSSDFPILKQFFPGIPYAIMVKLEFTALFLSPITYTCYLSYLDKNIFNKLKIRYFVYIGLFFGVIVYGTPILISNRFVLPMQIYLISMIIIDLTALTIYLFKYKNFIGIFSIVTVGAIMLCAFNDILLSSQIGFRILGSELIPFSFVIFTFCQTIILAVTQIKNERKVQDLYNFLSSTNQAYNRFVPKQFLELFNYTDISQIEIGDKLSTNMMILSADIRNFTSISEHLSEMQVFDLLNYYFEKISPIIYKHGGIIEKFLGDGIIVFFQKNYAEALNCAIEMQEKMVELRLNLASQGLPELRIGIGVHYGNILVGTAGDASRMSEVSISTELAVLQHVESATKRYNKPIVVTREAMSAAASELRLKGEKFSFSGGKIPEAIGHELFSIYSKNMSLEL